MIAETGHYALILGLAGYRADGAPVVGDKDP